METPIIPFHKLNNMTDEELIVDMQHAGNEAVVSLCDRLSAYSGEHTFEELTHELRDEIENLKHENDEHEETIKALKEDINEEDTAMKESQAEALLNALQIKSMTKFEIFTELGIWNSGARINELRELGYAIETKMIDHVSVRWGKQTIAQYTFHEHDQKVA